MRRATWWSALLVGLVLMATTGCGTDRPAPGQAGGTGPGQATSSNQATSGNQSAPGNQASGGSTAGRSAPAGTGGTASGAVLIDFGRQGGLAGVTDQLVVREDGGYTLTRARPAVNRSGQLAPAELADLRAKLASSGFTKLPHVQPGGGMDMFTYHMTYQGTEILAQEAGLADALRPVVATLSAIVERSG